MSEAIVDRSNLNFDPDALRDKYREERDKRLRGDANDQYIEVKGDFSHFIEDPYLTETIEQSQLRDDVPDFAPGDTEKVHVKVVEGNRERVQIFQGVVIGRRGASIRESFKVRKLSFGVGVERTFPLHSPIIEKIEVVTRGDVRRAKLYYLRDRVGKSAKVKEKRY